MPRSSTSAHRVAVIGGSFSGNKGAASMVQAVVDRLPELAGPCSFAVLSASAADDRREPGGQRPDVDVVAWTPVTMISETPLALIAALLRSIGMPWRWACATPSLRALADADVVVDVAGISFVDGRGPVILAYNVLMVALPLLLGRRVVKCAQAVGPFAQRLNRAGARLVLPRVEHVAARGDRTLEHLRGLGLSNVAPAPDLAFAMHLPPSAVAVAQRLWPDGDRPRTTVVPSTVVAEYCAKAGIDYPRLMASMIQGVVERGHTVVLLAHSSRPGGPPSRTNDFPLCEDIASRLPAGAGWSFIRDALAPHELRAVIAEGDVLVAARFHAMVSALATGTPCLVTGWSHKYAEVLRQFGLEEQQVPYEDLDLDHLLDVYDRTVKDLDPLRDRIATALPQVRAAALDGLRPVVRALGG